MHEIYIMIQIKTEWTPSKRKWWLSGMTSLCKFKQSKRLFSLQRNELNVFCFLKQQKIYLVREKQGLFRKNPLEMATNDGIC
jgi:hypothetical protein